MRSIAMLIAGLAFGLANVSVAEAAKATPHKAAASAKPVMHAAKGHTCKAEFMYMKGGKCMDARNAKA